MQIPPWRTIGWPSRHTQKKGRTCKIAISIWGPLDLYIRQRFPPPPIIIQQQKYQMQVNRNRLVRWEREGKWGLGRLEWAPSLPQAANGVINGTRFEKKSGFTWKEEKFRLALCSDTVVLYNTREADANNTTKITTTQTAKRLFQKLSQNWH